jgi:Beta-L-arabinofuranosidase, GH127
MVNVLEPFRAFPISVYNIPERPILATQRSSYLMMHFSRRHFLTTSAAAAGSAFFPRPAFATPQDPVVDTIRKDGKVIGHEKIDWQVRPFSMSQVRVGDGPCKLALEADRQYLHSLPPDRLLHNFRINAGFPSTAQPLGGWEAPDCELRGHYAGGHYLSACALMYASTGDEDLRKNATTVVAELGKCQDALKSGYLSAFPVDFFDRLRERERVWAPFYTIHKIMAGLLDMYLYCGNEQALDICQKMAGWVAGYSGPFSYDQMQRILGTEYGGMGEVLCNLYAGQALLPCRRRAFRQKVVSRSLGGTSRRTQRTARKYAHSSGYCRSEILRAHRRYASSRHRGIFLGRGRERALLLHRGHEQPRVVEH